MSELILHNYDFSNYAEKARLALGYKGLAWRSVIIPPVAPKPDLTPLTGGYRRTPVLQIGADIYCDTRRILGELERRQPEPTFYPASLAPAAHAIAFWAENQLFRPISLAVSAVNHDVLPPNLQVDRSQMRGLPPPDPETVRRAGQRNLPAMRHGIGVVDGMLADGRRWIAGAQTSIADFAVYHALWFITARTDRLAQEMAPYPRILAWMDRMQAFGHGACEPMDASDALSVAAAHAPLPIAASQGHPEDPSLGTRVRIRADDYGREPVEGELVFIDRDAVALRRHDPVIGEVVVHFPRLGYDLRPVG